MPFEDRLGEAMRHTGDSFELEHRRDLVETGLVRGRRRLARRRTAAVAGSVLALAAVGLGSAYAGGLVGGTGPDASVAAPPKPTQQSGDSSGEQMVALFKSLLPAGTLTEETGRGAGGPGGLGAPYASAVFDDGKGAGLVSLGVSRVDPGSESGSQQVTCPAPSATGYDACKAEKLADGSRYMLFQGYEYPDRREPTKSWRAVLLTPDGALVDASEWNAPAEKGAQVSRDTPPLTAEQLKSLVTSPKWLPVAYGLKAPEKRDPVRTGPSAEAVQKQLVALLPAGKSLKVVEKDGQDGYASLVVDDGEGRSLVQVNVQTGMSDVAPSGETSTLPDGTRIGLEKQQGEKGGAGVVWWTADTVRPDGFRVVVSAFNTGDQHKAATRAKPVLTLNELRTIALDPHWLSLK
ncbi:MULTISPECIES: hypothetical protein [unclassified Streptomyces]|uniref:hypothetical protein n=1 Tax=unclassified Streptomyces TaxID=2593676 RepID=UPI0038150561